MGIRHVAAVDQRHAAARDAADALTSAAGPDIIDRGQDITHPDTVLVFGQGAVAEKIMTIAPCGCYEDVLAGAVMLVSELALRLAAAERRIAAGPVPSTGS